MVVKFYFKRNNIVSSYNPIRETIPVIYNSIDDIKFALHSGSLTLFRNVSTVCCDSPSLSSAPSSKVTRCLLGASLYGIDIY